MPYLTAILGLRPTNRKAAVMERVRAVSEQVFWSVMAEQREAADLVAVNEDAKARREAWKSTRKVIAGSVITAGAKAGLAEPVIQGLCRDVDGSIGSYIGLKAAGQLAEWPAPLGELTDYADRLDAFAATIDRKAETLARDELTRGRLTLPVRPLTLARSRDAMLIRTREHGAISVVLNLLRANDKHGRATHGACRQRISNQQAGIEAVGAAPISDSASKCKIIVPIECSKWHEHMFMSGNATLRSSLLFRRGDRWFLAAQFEMPEPKEIALTGARIGIQRSIDAPVLAAAVAANGAVRDLSEPAGREVGPLIEKADQKRRSQQQRRGVTDHRHVPRVDAALHLLANAVVQEAKSRGAIVVMEDRTQDKQRIVKARPSWARGQGRHYLLRRAQLGVFEKMLDYKLQKAGMQPIRYVVGGGLGKYCSACGSECEKGKCLTCGAIFPYAADRAVKVARRAIVLSVTKRGEKLAPRERDMVQGLWSLDDGGLGPLVGQSADGLVAGHAAAPLAYPASAGITSGAGQNSRPMVQNAANSGVFGDRHQLFRGQKSRKRHVPATR